MHPGNRKLAEYHRSRKIWIESVRLVAGGESAGHFERFSQTAAHRSQRESRHVLFGRDGQVGGLAGKLEAAIQAQAGFLEELGGEAQVFGAVHTPEPKLFLVALKEVESFLKLFHGAIERAGQEVDTERPGMAGVVHLDADAILATLIAFHAAAVIVTGGLSAICHCVHQSKEMKASESMSTEEPRTRLCREAAAELATGL